MLMLSYVEFAKRRQQLMQKMGNDSVAIIPTTHEIIRNGDSHYAFRPSSDFYYLTGFAEPDAIAVLLPDNANGKYILFNRANDALHERWNGKRAGQLGAINEFGADESFPITEFAQRLPELLAGRSQVYFPIGRDFQFDQQVLSAVNTICNKVRSSLATPISFKNIETELHEMRLIKSADEIAMMRKAAQISAQAHKRLMQMCRPGLYEYHLQAELLHEFCQNGALDIAYESIIGSGANACILHYRDNKAPLKDGDLVLIDAGCEYGYYASDVTRTFPINGRFTAEQRAIYEIVLAAHDAAIAAVRPGLSWHSMQATCVKVITEGLVKLGLLHGNVEELINKQAYLNFYMHNSGHWLGLDVHDAGNYKIQGEWRKLETGMVFTVEPGIYIAANTPHIDPKWWNIGVRIEDDILVTENGYEILSVQAPTTIEEIEALMNK